MTHRLSRSHPLRLPIAALVFAVVMAWPEPPEARGQSPQSPPPASAARTAPADAAAATRLARYSDAMLARYWALHPDDALYVGYYAVADRLAVPDAAWRGRQRSFLQTELKALDGFDASGLTAAQRLDLTLMRQRFEAELWQLDSFKAWQWQPSTYNVAGGLALQLETEYAPLDLRLRQISSRLALVPAYYAAARQAIAQPTLEHTQLALQQHAGTLDVLGSRMTAAVDGSVLSDAEKAVFRSRQTAARAAVQAHQRWLADLAQTLQTSGARSFRIGAALYEEKFRHDIQSGLPAAELHRMALAEKARLHTRMHALARQLWPKWMGGAPMPADRLLLIGAVIDKLSERHVKAEEFVDAIRAQIPALEAFVREKDLLDQDPSRPLVVREMPAWQRGVAGANIQAPGPYDATANTYYNVSPLTDYTPERAASFLREYNHWMLQILNIHEAIPGHYTQMVHANKSPSRIKTLFGNGAMIEGWAVYSELAMLEAGYGAEPENPGTASPEMWLIWMKWNLRSVCNTVIDFEIQTGDMGRDTMMSLLTREAFQTEAEASDKWRRATLSQVQLTSYYAGYAQIVALRERLKARQGAAFRLKDFHNRFLSYGNVPVREIAALMEGQTRP